MTAVITPPGGLTTPPTGSVTFFIDGASAGSAVLVNGTASIAGPTTLAVGSHALTASYSGDTNYLPLTSLSGTHAVILAPITVALTAFGPTTIYFDQPADSGYDVIVANSAHPPTGTITVQDNGVSISYCTSIPDGSTCPYAAGGTNRLTVGTHSLVVLYNGDSFNAPGTSNPLVFTVLAATTTATVTSSLNPATVGTPVTFTANVAGTPVSATGNVTFFDGATQLATMALDANGNATFTTSTLSVGSHPITVAYAGSTNFNPATSAVLNQIINAAPPEFTLSVTPNPVTVGAGATSALLVAVTGNASFNQTVTLTCSGLPEETACNFVTPPLPAGGGSTTLQLHVSAPHDCGTTTPYFIGSTDGPASPVPYAFAAVFLGSLAIFRRRKKTAGTVLLVLLALFSLASLSGCGHCTDLGTRPGNYSFTVIATPQGGPVTGTQSVTVPLTVTIP